MKRLGEYGQRKRAQRYGPPGVAAHDPEYQAHYRFCVKLGRKISWDEYQSNPASSKRYNPGKYGPPGAKSRSVEAHRHRQYCYWAKRYYTWDEYQAILNDPKKPRNMADNMRNNSLTPESIAERKAATVEKFRRLGLVA